MSDELHQETKPAEQEPYAYRALDINVIGFTALSFTTNLASEVTKNDLLHNMSIASGTFAGVIALASLAAHIKSRRL